MIRFKPKQSMNRSWITILSLSVISHLASPKVLLIGKNTVLSFDDVETTITPNVGSSEEPGLLYAAEPIDTCSNLTNTAKKGSKTRPSYVLIVRGGCSCEEKVRKAQKAGFKVAIVYNDVYDELLVPRSSSGLQIHSVLVTRASGEVLNEYAGRTDIEIWLIAGSWTSSLLIMAIAFISLFIVSVVLASFFFVSRHQRVMSLSPGGRGFSRIPCNLVQRIRLKYFQVFLKLVRLQLLVLYALMIIALATNSGSYLANTNSMLCIDSWLGHWRSFCLVCKHDARAAKGDPPTLEQTPLLSPSLNSITSLQSLPIAM